MRRTFKMMAGFMAGFCGLAVAASSLAEEVHVEGLDAYANGQVLFSNLSPTMPYVLSGRSIGEYFYNRIRLSSFLPEGTRIHKHVPLPPAEYFGEAMPSIFGEAVGKTGERIGAGMGWGYAKRKSDGLRGIFLVEYVGSDPQEKIGEILRQSWKEAGQDIMDLEENTFDHVEISAIVPKDKKWGYVVASVDVPKLYWHGGYSGQKIKSVPKAQ